MARQRSSENGKNELTRFTTSQLPVFTCRPDRCIVSLPDVLTDSPNMPSTCQYPSTPQSRRSRRDALQHILHSLEFAPITPSLNIVTLRRAINTPITLTRAVHPCKHKTASCAMAEMCILHRHAFVPRPPVARPYEAGIFHRLDG